MKTTQKPDIRWIAYPATVELMVDGKRVGGIPKPYDPMPRDWWEERMREACIEAGVPFERP